MTEQTVVHVATITRWDMDGELITFVAASEEALMRVLMEQVNGSIEDGGFGEDMTYEQACEEYEIEWLNDQPLHK